jgi:Arc/MetJ-type ribon-helix-helix transcriptional regulator
MGMKVSVSLAGEDVAFLDVYAKERGLDSRSAALQRAVRMLRASELVAAYESAWEEWDAAGSAGAWDAAAGDGLSGSAAATGDPSNGAAR